MKIKKIITLLILYNLYFCMCYAGVVTYRNYNDIDYTVYVFEMSEDDNYNVFDIVKVPAGETIICEYTEPLTTIARIVISDRKGEKRIFEQPFFFLSSPKCTVHIYKKRIEISATFGPAFRFFKQTQLNMLLPK